MQCSQLDGLGLHGLETGGMDLGGDKVVHGVEVRPEAGDVPIPMKLKREAMGVEMVLKQTAEIGMVLVGMAALRGGAPPAPVEPHLAIKAYSNLEGLAECVAPHDIVSKKSLQSLLQQLILPKNSILPTVSSLTPARDVSTPAILASAAPISAEAVNISGKRSSNSHVTAKPKRASKPGVFKTLIACSKDSQSISSRDGNMLKKLARIRETSSVQPPVDLRHVHQKIASEVSLSKLDIISTASREPASSYIISLVTCDICKNLVNDTTSLVICDGCASGFHLPCLQTNEVLDVPEKIWYCTKCLSANGGRPRQALYDLYAEDLEGLVLEHRGF